MTDNYNDFITNNRIDAFLEENNRRFFNEQSSESDIILSCKSGSTVITGTFGLPANSQRQPCEYASSISNIGQGQTYGSSTVQSVSVSSSTGNVVCPSITTDSATNEDTGISTAGLVLAIVLPIAFVLMIIVIVAIIGFYIYKNKNEDQ